MTESDSVGVGSMYAPSPGALLRRARQAQGLHIAALAAALKVNPRKLELLENDQFDQLPDVAFARALAQAVCRHLKIEAPPVLALLPAATMSQPALERVTTGLNTPFRERAERDGGEWARWLHPRLLVPVLLLLAAVAFLWVPKGWIPVQVPWSAQAPAAGQGAASVPAATMPPAQVVAAAEAVVPQPGVAASDAAAAPASAPAAAAQPPIPIETVAPADGPERVPLAPPPVPLPAGLLAVRAGVQSWLEVTDARGDVLIARLLEPGEMVALDGRAPLQVTVGNAGGMEMRFKGRPVRLQMAPDNTARVRLR